MDGLLKARLATEKDIPDIVEFLNRVWGQMGLSHVATEETYLKLNLGAKAEGQRMSLLFDGDKIVAALGSSPVKTDQGLGFMLHTVAVEQRPDKIDLLDEISLWSARLAVLENRPIITFSSKEKSEYGRDMLGMDVEDAGVNTETGEVKQQGGGDCRLIIGEILKRHPEW